MNETRIGIVGCGAVTAKGHLPALGLVPGARVVALADPALERARELAGRFGVPRVAADFREILDGVDALVLALPHHLHAPVGIAALAAGKPVLMEKPLAATGEECDALLAASAASGARLSVALVRRHMPAVRAAREWIAGGLLGDIESFEVEEGAPYAWPVASDFFFRPETAGGGVLLDTGAHVLDTLRLWLGDLRVESYDDDCAGGVEADCTLGLRTAAGAGGRVTLSRLRTLANRCVLRGSRADLEVMPFANQARLTPRGAACSLHGGCSGAGGEGGALPLAGLFKLQAEEWLKSLRGEPSETAAGEDGRAGVELVRAAYAMRKPRPACWERPVCGGGS